MTPRFYIRQNSAGALYAYWMQSAQNWTLDPFAATLFDTEIEANSESTYAARATKGDIEVCLQSFAPRVLRSITAPDVDSGNQVGRSCLRVQPHQVGRSCLRVQRQAEQAGDRAKGDEREPHTTGR